MTDSSIETNNVIDISGRRPVTVYLLSYNAYKVNVIKVVKDEFGLGLADAKTLVESAPCEVRTYRSKAAADRLKSELEGAGATVEIHGKRRSLLLYLERAGIDANNSQINDDRGSNVQLFLRDVLHG